MSFTSRPFFDTVDSPTSLSASTKWEIANPKHLSGVSGIDFFDILSDGVPDMIVAREDGMVEVYNFETTDEPILKYTYVSAREDPVRIFDMRFPSVEWLRGHHQYRRWNSG